MEVFVMSITERREPATPWRKVENSSRLRRVCGSRFMNDSVL
jgi:hypothetical protein